MAVNAQYVTVLSGYSVSEPFTLFSARFAGVIFPAVTSCAAYAQAGFAANSSANFHRIYQVDAASYWVANVGLGSVAIPLTTPNAFPYLRIEMGVAQTDTRTLTVFAKS